MFNCNKLVLLIVKKNFKFNLNNIIYLEIGDL